MLWITPLPAVFTIPPIVPIQFGSPMSKIANTTKTMENCTTKSSAVISEPPISAEISSTAKPRNEYNEKEILCIFYIGFFAPVVFILCIATAYFKRVSGNRARANLEVLREVRLRQLEVSVDEI